MKLYGNIRIFKKLRVDKVVILMFRFLREEIRGGVRV